MINKQNIAHLLIALWTLGAFHGTATAFSPPSHTLLSETVLRFTSSDAIHQAGGQVYSLGAYTTIEIPSDQLFDVNSADFLPGAARILTNAASVINLYPSFKILISANTSGFESSAFERTLSEDRARQVASFFWSREQERTVTGGLLPHLTYVGSGNYFPISNTFSNRGIRQNSRIQITIYPSHDYWHPLKKENGWDPNYNIGALDETPVSAPLPEPAPKETVVLPATSSEKDPFPLYDEIPVTPSR